MLASELEAKRKEIAAELERAVDAAHSIGRLKQSQWYQDRKAQMLAYDQQIAWLTAPAV